MIFDLWDTLALFTLADEGTALCRELAASLGVPEARFLEAWSAGMRLRSTGPLDAAFGALCSELGIDARNGAFDDFRARRLELNRRALVPRDGALETLDAVRARGYATGLITVCGEEVPALWEGTPFAPRLDATVFSCAEGLHKPEPEIYLLACERLEVPPERCVFVGDGANDELAGAARVGMRAVLVLPPGRAEPLWDEARGWEPRITELPPLLDLLDAA